MKKFTLLLAIILITNFELLGGGIKKGVRISYSVTDAQISFVDSVFDYLITPFLSQKIRDEFSNTRLLLYRSIQGTWEGFSQFDWNFINGHENMFCHSDSSVQNYETRITTKWSSFLMDGRDLVDPAAPDALSHWINYYAVTASTQVYEYNYDGLFIDSASHLLKPSMMLTGEMPWDYDPLEWRLARYNSLKFIKSHFPDKIVIFNGLHNGAGADSSLSVTDGGMWEDFAFDADSGSYKGIQKWRKAINCMIENRGSSNLVLVVKKPGLIQDIQARIFSVASYLLIENQNTVLTLSDYAYDTALQYFPEFDIDLGNATTDINVSPDSVCSREFENGLVIVNPSSTLSKSFYFSKNYWRIVPVGGGFVDTLGHWNGNLTYEELGEGNIELPPVSALILKDSTATNIGNEEFGKIDFQLYQNYPNPFGKATTSGNPTTTIKYSIPALETQNFASPQKVINIKLKIYDIIGREVATLVNKQQSPGNYYVNFNAMDLPSGVYFYRLNVNGKFINVKKMVLLK
jgi:hypothetical protein